MIKINESTVDFKVSKRLMDDTKKVYSKLKQILNPDKVKRESDIVKKIGIADDLVKQAFKEIGGRVGTSDHTPTYFRYDGSVKSSYTIGGSISTKDGMLSGDMNRLAEDLTMAYFKTNGGDCKNTMDLIAYIKSGSTRYGTNFVFESKRSKNMIKINESIEEVKDALNKAGIPNRQRGNSMIVVPRSELQKASEIKNKIDPSITIGSQA